VKHVFIHMSDRTLFEELRRFKKALGLRWSSFLRLLLENYKDSVSYGDMVLCRVNVRSIYATPIAFNGVKVVGLKPVRNSRVIGKVKDALSRGDVGELLKYKFVAYAGNIDLKTRLYFRVLHDRSIEVYDSRIEGKPVKPEDYDRLVYVMLQHALNQIYKFCRKIDCGSIIFNKELLTLQPIYSLVERERARMKEETIRVILKAAGS